METKTTTTNVPSTVRPHRRHSAVSDISESFVPSSVFQQEERLDSGANVAANTGTLQRQQSDKQNEQDPQAPGTEEGTIVVAAQRHDDPSPATTLRQEHPELHDEKDVPVSNSSIDRGTAEPGGISTEEETNDDWIQDDLRSEPPGASPGAPSNTSKHRSSSERCSAATTTTTTTSSDGQILPTFKAQATSVVYPAATEQDDDDDDRSTGMIRLYKPTGQEASTGAAVVVDSVCFTKDDTSGTPTTEDVYAEAPAILVPVRHVAIPTTAPVEELQETSNSADQKKEPLIVFLQRRRYCRWMIGLLIVLFVAALTTLSVCVTGRCSSGSSHSSRPEATTTTPLYTPSPERIQTLSALAQRLSKDDIAYPPTHGTPQEYALQWLLDTDPLQLTVGGNSQALIQRYVLAVAAFSMGLDDSVLNGRDTCSWEGIRGCIEGAATQLDWSQQGLTGTVPYELVHLAPSLTVLSLADNQLTGTIPAEWRNDDATVVWPVLEQWNVRGNALTGPMPSASTSTLRLWDTSDNAFTGPLPLALTQSTNLEHFLVSDNSLTGTIPQGYVQNWRYLQTFSVFANDLTGTLPDDLDEAWPDLIVLEVNNNRFSGSIPRGMPEGLQSVFLYGNNDLTGTVHFCESNNFAANVVADCNRDDVTCECCSLCCPGSSWC